MNRLIAEFMGLVESGIPNKYWTEKSSEGFGIGQLTELRFDTDWNWLMQVVEKITCMREFQEYYPSNSTFWELYNQVSIEAVYQAVIDFIKWYNEQK